MKNPNYDLGPAAGAFVRAPNANGGTFVYHKIMNTFRHELGNDCVHLTNCGRRIGGLPTEAATHFPVCPDC